MRILVGYDGSNASKDAVRLAIKQAKAFEGRIFLVTSHVGGPGEKADNIRKAEQELAYRQESVEKEGVACENHLLIIGLSPGEALVEFAKEHDIDMVVIGVRRRSRVDKMVFGSTAQYTILNAPCPVLTVH
jgi:nucleotide-binding universal stress UspA family protein